MPKADPEPIVYLEITLEAQVKPSAGLVAVDGRITPASFLFAKAVRITGGFAFYIWFAGDHEGDFVISIGGYHPRYKKPDHYPVVPRLQLAYQTGNLSVIGQSYLALTPSMLMAGLRIDATWNTAALSAWFSAGIDFLLGWRPFHYEADAYVHIGVSLTIDLFTYKYAWLVFAVAALLRNAALGAQRSAPILVASSPMMRPRSARASAGGTSRRGSASGSRRGRARGPGDAGANTLARAPGT